MEDNNNQPVAYSLEPSSFRRTLRTLTYWIAFLVVGRWVIDRNLNFVFLIVLSWLAAIAMDPVISWLSARGLRRGAATGVVMAGLVILGALFLALFGGILFTQAASLIESVPSLVTSVVEWLNTTFKLTLDPTQVITKLNISPSQIANWAGNFAGGIVGVLSTLIGGIFQLLTMSLFAFYFAAEGPRVRRVIASWLQPTAQKVFVTTWDIAVRKTGGFVVSKMVLAAFSATAHGIFFAVIGIPYWLPMALITGITSQFIPTVGTYLGILVPILFAVFNNPLDALWIAVFAGIYQQIENYFLSPRISRRTMDIHPAIAFGSVIIFANLFGAMGALIAIPLAAAIVAIVDTYGHRYELIPELGNQESR